MVTAEFLQDNGFSNKASVDANVYIKDVTKALPSSGNLHAHLKVTFADAHRLAFEIHGTIRVDADAQALGKRSGDDSTIGRALWVYADGTFRTSVEAEFWQKQGSVTLSQLKSYARKLKDQVVQWEKELESKGGESAPSLAGNKHPLDKLDTLYPVGR
ncbi:hypothetical protein NB699_003630 [Xanthomonas sacchari]|uniref:Uncharacterized protein n=1 Tax=Xanthomonas sacchari TaxID=56458 RepID=A0AA46Y918_9XANT|nr:hypothetical protein [Xanthomonas sacchari]MCW0368647.1 hypothetical protein [Xanthomonas sacchari]MCW0442003.1 hypothetical protein [Xanthomonas sacchari]UYK89053.1 hypothetical protein NG824_00890 [Xanthomonas sacchari]